MAASGAARSSMTRHLQGGGPARARLSLHLHAELALAHRVPQPPNLLHLL